MLRSKHSMTTDVRALGRKSLFAAGYDIFGIGMIVDFSTGQAQGDHAAVCSGAHFFQKQRECLGPWISD